MAVFFCRLIGKHAQQQIQIKYRHSSSQEHIRCSEAFILGRE